MLPAEAAALGHPQLRMLWHARRAEHALLTYRVEGTEWETTTVETEVLHGEEGRRPRPQRGPIIAVVDTSGSMSGVPERVAKALALQCLTTAHAEGRDCLLYAHSGPGDLIEHRLSLAPEGIAALLAFLGMSFGGGTDVSAPLLAVVERLSTPTWAKADVLWVSDGEFPVPTRLSAAVARARDNGTRLHGVQIGNAGTTGLHQLCQPVHVFSRWSALLS